jgi:hypothetical protein
MLTLILFLSLAGAQSAAASTETAAVDTAAAQESSRERLICRSRPMLGSRIARQRVCKTEEEWRIYENDMAQSRRDINDRGARGCTPTSCE